MFVYILHFDSPLSHASHYVGSTTDLRRRLKEHAAGTGARLTQVIKELGITWRLSTLYLTNTFDHKRIEKMLKKQKNAPRYCRICSAKPSVPRGCTPYPISILKKQNIPTKSGEMYQETLQKNKQPKE